ncbi:MAG: VOC family protein [Steroidobacteraceae bacterium]
MSKIVSPRKGIAAAPAYAHIGLCVSDIERSMRFYSEGLGFVAGARIETGSELSHFVGVPKPMTMLSQFMSLGGLNIELLGFPLSRITPRDLIPRPMSRAGVTHLSFYVHDPVATATQLVALGGTLHEETRVDIDHFAGTDVSVSAVFCTDPDGTRIELMCFSDNFPGFTVA